jgi:hypothetical protein
MSGAGPAWRVLAFSPESFDRELFALARQVPLLDHLLCRLDERHDPFLKEDRVLRNHHRDLMAHGGFTIRLPQAGATLRSGRAVMLEDKTVFYGVQGRPDLLLAEARVGYGHPLSAVVLPRQRVVLTIRGHRWNADVAAAQRALALFAAAGVDPCAPADGLPRVLVTGDVNYAHHVWNQLGALAAVLEQGAPVRVLATHQPIAPIAEIFDDHPGLSVTPVALAALPRLDPGRVLPVAAGGLVVRSSVRARIGRVAERHASPAVLGFLARSRPRALIWLGIRQGNRTAVNLFDALAALALSLLREARFGLVLDGFSLPNDAADNPNYDRTLIDPAIGQEQMFAERLLAHLVVRLGAAVAERVFVGIGGGLLDSIHLAAQCRAYFAHHGTLQHRLGYFTTVPGQVHSNPAILAGKHAAAQRYAIEDPGAIDYIPAGLVADWPAPGAPPFDSNNTYRFVDIPALVSGFRAFLARHGIA